MVPAGYMAKVVAPGPSTVAHPRVLDVCSVSRCISRNFDDYIDAWRHNGYWFFDRPETIGELARERGVDLTKTTLFYYEVMTLQYDEPGGPWTEVAPEPAFVTEVLVPEHKRLVGYDVVTFSAGSSAECSPLSCNAVATDARVAGWVNEHCLLSSAEVAIQLLESGDFEHSEPGPYRVFAVYIVEWGRLLWFG